MRDSRDCKYATDKSGETWAIDSDGNWLTINGERIPGPPEREEGVFTCYDSSRGHCGLCGRLTCTGRCFK